MSVCYGKGNPDILCPGTGYCRGLKSFGLSPLCCSADKAIHITES